MKITIIALAVALCLPATHALADRARRVDSFVEQSFRGFYTDTGFAEGVSELMTELESALAKATGEEKEALLYNLLRLNQVAGLYLETHPASALPFSASHAHEQASATASSLIDLISPESGSHHRTLRAATQIRLLLLDLRKNGSMADALLKTAKGISSSNSLEAKGCVDALVFIHSRSKDERLDIAQGLNLVRRLSSLAVPPNVQRFTLFDVRLLLCSKVLGMVAAALVSTPDQYDAKAKVANMAIQAIDADRLTTKETLELMMPCVQLLQVSGGIDRGVDLSSVLLAKLRPLIPGHDWAVALRLMVVRWRDAFGSNVPSFRPHLLKGRDLLLARQPREAIREIVLGLALSGGEPVFVVDSWIELCNCYAALGDRAMARAAAHTALAVWKAGLLNANSDMGELNSRLRQIELAMTKIPR